MQHPTGVSSNTSCFRFPVTNQRNILHSLQEYLMPGFLSWSCSLNLGERLEPKLRSLNGSPTSGLLVPEEENSPQKKVAKGRACFEARKFKARWPASEVWELGDSISLVLQVIL